MLPVCRRQSTSRIGWGVGTRVLVTPPTSCFDLMISTRRIPDRLLVAASGRTTRIIDYRASAWLYGLDGVADLQPEFSVPHGAWRRGPFDHQRRRIDDLEIVAIEGELVASVSQ